MGRIDPNDQPYGDVATDHYPPRIISREYPGNRPPPLGPGSNPLTKLLTWTMYVPVPTGGQTHGKVNLTGVPGGYAIKNVTDSTLRLGLGRFTESDLIGGSYADEVAPGSYWMSPWPQPEDEARNMTWWLPGAAVSTPGYVRFMIFPYGWDPGVGGGALPSGPAKAWAAYTGSIVADGAHAHDVTLTLPQTSDGLLIANDSASGQGGISFYVTDKVDSSGAPIFPSPLPTTGQNAPFTVAQGKEYPVDSSVAGVLISNVDAVNGATYRVWVVD